MYTYWLGDKLYANVTIEFRLLFGATQLYIGTRIVIWQVLPFYLSTLELKRNALLYGRGSFYAKINAKHAISMHHHHHNRLTIIIRNQLSLLS